MTRDSVHTLFSNSLIKESTLILGVILELDKFKLLSESPTETEITKALSHLRMQRVSASGHLLSFININLTTFATLVPISELNSPASAPSSEKQSPMAQQHSPLAQQSPLAQPSPATPNSPVTQPAPPQPLQLQGHENR